MTTTFSKTASKLERKKPATGQRRGQQPQRRQQQPRRAPKQNQSKSDIKSQLVNILKIYRISQ